MPWNYSSKDLMSLSTGATRRNYSGSAPSCSPATLSVPYPFSYGTPRAPSHRHLRVILPLLADKHLTVLINNVGYNSTYVPRLRLAGLTRNRRGRQPPSPIHHPPHPHPPPHPDQKPARTRRQRHWVLPLPLPGRPLGGKAYLNGFSRTLAIAIDLVREPPADIECLAVDVHNVATNPNRSTMGFFVPTWETMGKASVGVVGCGSVTAYWKAELVSWVLR